MYADTLETAALWGLPIYTMDVLREKVRERANKHLYPLGVVIPEFITIVDYWAVQLYEHLFTEKTDIVIVDSDIAKFLGLKYRDSVDYNRKAKDIEVGDTLYSGEKITEVSNFSVGKYDYVRLNSTIHHVSTVLEIV